MSINVNTEGIILASAARTTTALGTSIDFDNYNSRFLTLFVNVSADSGADITPSLQYKDPISDTYETIWTAAAAISATGQFGYQLGPGLLASAGGAWVDTENVVIPKTWRVVVSHNDTTSITYSGTYSLNV